jgi:trimethylamine--corrinoid protein Co-methyltransferase
MIDHWDDSKQRKQMMENYSSTPDILSISSHQKIEILSQSELDSLRKGSYQLLAEVGVYYPSEQALSIFADHGAKVDWETKIVHIPPDLVDKAMATAPRNIVLAGREPRFDLLLDGSRSYLTTDGCGVHVIDLETREKRASRKADVAMMARIADAIPLVSFFWPSVSAQDFGITAPLHEC